MIVESIILSIFVVSLGIVMLMLIHKLPAVFSLPQNGQPKIQDHKIFFHLKERAKNVLLAFEKQVFLHKALSWVKIMTIRLETKIDRLLHKIRRRNQKMPG